MFEVPECAICLEEDSIDLGTEPLRIVSMVLDTETMDDDTKILVSPLGRDIFFGLHQTAAIKWIQSPPNLTDTVLYVRESGCSGTEVACDEDGGDGYTSLFQAEFEQGVAYTIVDGYSSSYKWRGCVDIVRCQSTADAQTESTMMKMVLHVTILLWV